MHSGNSETDSFFRAMSLSGTYGAISDEEGLAVLKKTYDLGISFWDTAAVYGLGHNERLIGQFLEGNPGARGKLFIASKCAFEVSTNPPALMLADLCSFVRSSIRSLGKLRVSPTRRRISRGLSTTLQKDWTQVQIFITFIEETQRPL